MRRPGLPLTGIVLAVGAWMLHGADGSLFAASDPAARSAEAGPPGAGDWACGPRSVRCILEFYGVKADVVELVRETQWPRLEEGATMAALKAAIEKRGIHTYAMEITPHARLHWEYPVLAHLRGEAGGGHYVVWLPEASSDRTRSAAAGEPDVTVTTEELADLGSGVVLLTSPVPIADPPSATRPVLSLATWITCGVARLVLLLFLVRGGLALRRAKDVS